MVQEDVIRKALVRYDYEGGAGDLDEQSRVSYVLQNYAYYQCYKCQKAYYGGNVQCQVSSFAVEYTFPIPIAISLVGDAARRL